MANQLYAYNLSSFGPAPHAAPDPDPAPAPAPLPPSSLSSIFSSSRSISDIVSTRYLISETLASNLASKYSTVTHPTASMYLNQSDVLRFASSHNTSRAAHYVPQSSWHAADVEPSLDSVSGMKRSFDVPYETILGTRDTVGPSQAWYTTNSLAKRTRFENASNIPLYPQRPGEKDCAHYMLTRSCGFGNSCKFDHPIWVPEGGIPDWKEVPQIATDESLPERPGEPDCPYFLKTQRCKFGLRCKFNHPKDQLASTDASENTDISALPERPSEPPCAFYMKTGKCKFGVICKFHHPKELLVPSAEQENCDGGRAESLGVKVEGASGDPKLFKSPVRFTAALSYNSKGLPIRPEEVDCPFYIKTGSCKYGVTCRYNHPDRNAIFQPSASLVHPFVSPASATLSTRTVNSVYQNINFRLVQQVAGAGTSSTMYPQRPGQSECDYYMKTGVCKFGERCKFHHPVDRSAPNAKNVAQQNVKLTLAGLPRREGATMCPYYLKTGTCKYGGTCKFDHPPPGEVMAMALQGTSTADKSEGKEDE